MIDRMSFKIQEFTLKEWCRLAEQFEQTSKSRRNKIMMKWHNLRFTYYPNIETLAIDNSLHKFFNAMISELPIGAENYDDFTFTKLLKTIQFLCDFIQRNPDECIIQGKFEYGLNLNVEPIDVRILISCYIGYNSGSSTNRFEHKEPKYGKVISRNCYLTEYIIKMYSKSHQSEFCPYQHILRFEICNNGVGRLKHLLGLQEVTLENLMDENTLMILANDLLKVYRKIIKVPFRQNDVKRKDMLEILGYSEPIIIDYDKTTLTKWKYHQQRKSVRTMLLDFENSEESIHQRVGTKISNKLHQLITT